MYYRQVPLAHVEAGLRTWDKHNPFPEGINKALVDAVLSLKSDAANRRAMGARGRSYMERHASWGQRARASEGMLLSVVERRRRRA